MVPTTATRDGAGSPPSAEGRRSSLAGLYVLGSWLLAVSVLIQSVIAGQATFGSWAIEVHGWLGNVSFLLAVVLLATALAAKARRARVIIAAGLVVAMAAQTGLGYAGRSELQAAAVHIPLGVAIFGMAIYNLGATRTDAGRNSPVAGSVRRR